MSTRLEDILAQAPVGMALFRGTDHVCDFANPAFLDALGGRVVLGQTLRDALPELGDDGIAGLLGPARAPGTPQVRSLDVALDHGTPGAVEQRTFDVVCQPVVGGDGRVDALCVVAFDVTDLSRARHDAETAHRMTELALETGRLGSWRIDLRTRARWNSPRCLANFGLPAGTPLSYEDVIAAQHPDDREHVRLAMARSIETGLDYAAEYRVFWPDGSVHWLSARGRTMYAPDGTPLFMAGNTLDITEQRRLFDELRQTHDALECRVAERTAELADSNAQLARALAERTALEDARSGWLRAVMSAQEDERRRVARELHDEMSQHLLALTIGLDALTETPAAEALSAQPIARLQAIVSRIDQSVHRLARDLRPAELDDLGLAAAVKAYVDEWSQRTGIAGDASSRQCEERLPPPVESALYRIVQEALTNVARHARARHASVVIERRVDSVLVVIEDDGVGFDVEAMRVDGDGARFGLVGMRERAALLGGSVALESTAGGTGVFVAIPLAAGRHG